MPVSDQRPEIQMRLDGEFVAPPKATWPFKIGVAAVIAAVVVGGVALAALALWLAMLLIPVAIVAGLIGWAALRFQLWRSGRSFGSLRYPPRR